MIGTDIVFMPRFEDKPELAKKILSEKEFLLYQTLSSKRQTEFLAGRFAAKEAIAKASGFGLGTDNSVKLKSISILPNASGAPIVEGIEACVSISHDGDYAVAVALLR